MYHSNNHCCNKRPPESKSSCDHGPKPFAGNIKKAVLENNCFRRAYWSEKDLQVTLMTIPVNCDIGLEFHPDVDQFLYIESGQCCVMMGHCKEKPECKMEACEGHGIFIPSSTWHNIINTGRCPLKLFSVYAPQQHPTGTIHCTKEHAEKAEHSSY